MWCQVEATAAVTGQGCPLVRTKHAMCFTSDGHIYMYGGRSMSNKALRDLWRFDTGQDQWEEVVPRDETLLTHRHFDERHAAHYNNNNAPSSRSSSSNSSAEGSPQTPDNNFEPPPALQEHTMVAAKDKLYLFGGQVGYSSDETPLWIFDLGNARWSKFGGKVARHNASSQPLGRRGHTAVLYRNIMSIYGGYQDFKGSTSELWTFHLGSQEWTLEGKNFQKCSNAPPARHAHSAVVYDESMFVYGGMTDLQVRGDFWSWHYKSKKWMRIKTLKNPGELCCHSAIVVANSMFIYGGERANGNSVSELWRYRFDAQTWQQVNITGIVPGCRTRHAAVAIPCLKWSAGPGLDWDVAFGDFEGSEHQKKNKSNFSRNNRREQETQVDIELDYLELQPKKSISLCFEPLENGARSLMSPAETEPKKKIIKSHSFKHGRRSPMMSNFCAHSETLSDEDELLDEDDLLQQVNLTSPEKEEAELENDQNATNLLNMRSAGGYQQKVAQPPPPPPPQVRMRPRRPLLQRQRPYSDFYASNTTEEFELGEMNEKQLKRRSVQESMSYYSLCFPTPPPSLKFNHSPSAVPMSPVIEPADSRQATNPSSPQTAAFQASSSKSTDIPSESDAIVRRRDNSSIKRRMRKANLELRELNSVLMTSTDSGHFNSAYYSLSLDISPDYEKELKCVSTLFTPSHDLSSSTDHYEEEEGESEEIAPIDLDLIEDYLEPEEMLQVVAESFDDQSSPTLQLKTINKTPARRMASHPRGEAVGKQPEPRTHRAPSVSHSSSGYQSLILADGVPTTVASFDLMSNPSLSNSSSFVDHDRSKCAQESLNQALLTRSITLNLPSANKKALKSETIELKPLRPHDGRMQHEKSRELSLRSRSLERAQDGKVRCPKPHWQPNVKEFEVIREMIVPRSPAIIHKFDYKPNTNQNHNNLNGDSTYLNGADGAPLQLETNGRMKASFASFGRRFHRGGRFHPNGFNPNWQLCMYVFGGREETAASSLLNSKQPITIWKLYI